MTTGDQDEDVPTTHARPCRCGSGLPSSWAVDARGVELARVCPRCEERVLAGYRPEVLHDGAYELDEDIDADDGFGFGLLGDAQ